MIKINKISKFDAVINEIKNNNYESALELISEVKTNTEEEHLKNKLYGSIYFKKKNWSKCIEYFSKILSTNENDIVVLNNMGVALFNFGKLNDSIKYFKKLSTKENNSHNAFTNLGIAYKNLGDYGKAVQNFIKALDIKKDNNLIKQNLIDIFNYYIPKETENNQLLKLNDEIFKLNRNLSQKKLFDKSFIRNFIKKNFNKLNNLNLEYKETQIFRRNRTNLNCDRHFKIFNEYNIIPKYCFNCYKIQIDLNDVVNLIKVFFIFNNINLENNNIRKCIVETRKNVSGNYKGYIFCNGLDEAKNIIKIVSREIRNFKVNIKDIKIKHGCTEYYERYPEYKKINLGEQKFKYTKEWKVKEDLVDSKFFKNNEKTIIPTINQINLSDILIIKNWISYAKLINDETYKEILSQEIDTGYFNEKIIDQISFRTNN